MRLPVSPLIPEHVRQKRISREVSAERLVISQRWGEWWHGVLLLLGALLLGYLAVIGKGIVILEGLGPPWLTSLVFGVLTVIVAYGGVAVMFNSTQLEVTREWLRVAKGPVPCGREFRMESAGILAVSYRENAEQGYRTRYDLVAVTAEGEHYLLPGLDTYEVTNFYVREIREFLNLPNRRLGPLV